MTSKVNKYDGQANIAWSPQILESKDSKVVAHGSTHIDLSKTATHL